MTYQHLSQEERYQIYALMETGKSNKYIAEFLKRHPSTIGREIRRNKGLRGYRPKQAQMRTEERALGSRNALRIDPTEWEEAKDYLYQQWSPEQISNALPMSHETIYTHIYSDKQAGGMLWKQLRCQKKRKKRYASGHDRRGQIVGRRPINERPVHIEKRQQVGHWEGDTIIGASHQQAIVTLVERKSGYVLMQKVTHKTAELVSNAIIEMAKPIASRVNTMTFDNGKEFASHTKMDEALNSTTYFADPFCSWQRGSNENTNGLIRQYIPKKRRLFTVNDEEVTMIQNRLNHRPRKRLGYKTPYEVFHQSLNRVALRT